MKCSEFTAFRFILIQAAAAAASADSARSLHKLLTIDWTALRCFLAEGNSEIKARLFAARTERYQKEENIPPLLSIYVVPSNTFRRFVFCVLQSRSFHSPTLVN